MAINKDDVNILEHELLSVKVDDNQSDKEYDYNFFIERNGTEPQVLPASAEFLVPTISSVSIASSSAAGSSAVVSTVAVQSMANLNFQSSQQTATPSEVHPLLPLNETSSTPNSNSSVSPTPTPSISRPSIQSNASPSQLSVLEKVTMASTRALHSVSGSLTSVAEDRILGRGNFVTSGQGRDARVAVREIGRIVSQIWPNDLSFYELGLLVDVVHKESPDYHILEGQCYWFVTVICAIIVLLYGNKLNPQNPTAKSPKDYLPNLGGRWKNMLIVAPEDEFIRSVAVKFMKRQEEAFSEVRFMNFHLFFSEISNR